MAEAEEGVAQAAHQALRTLYHVALTGDPHNAVQVTDAYLLLVDFIGEVAPCVEPERLLAVGRLLLHSGDITPMGVRMLEKIVTEAVT